MPPRRIVIKKDFLGKEGAVKIIFLHIVKKRVSLYTVAMQKGEGMSVI